MRGRRILEALRESDGLCAVVDEAEILAAQQDLARHGLYAEPTSATVVAALPQVAFNPLAGEARFRLGPREAPSELRLLADRSTLAAGQRLRLQLR